MPTKKQRLLEYLNFKLEIERQMAAEYAESGDKYTAACRYEDAHEIAMHIQFVESLPD